MQVGRRRGRKRERAFLLHAAGQSARGTRSCLEHENATNLWNYVSAILFGFFVMRQLYLMVKMSIPEYSGWDHTAATLRRTRLALLLVVDSVVFVQLWQVDYASNRQVAQGIVADTNAVLPLGADPAGQPRSRQQLQEACAGRHGLRCRSSR